MRRKKTLCIVLSSLARHSLHAGPAWSGTLYLACSTMADSCLGVRCASSASQALVSALMIGTLPGPKVLAGRSGRNANSISFQAASLFLLVLAITYWLGQLITLRPNRNRGQHRDVPGLFVVDTADPYYDAVYLAE